MDERKETRQSRLFKIAVTVAGLALWLAAAAHTATFGPTDEKLVLLALVPLAVIVGLFPITFPLPTGLKFTTEKINFTLSDAFVLLVALHYGVLPAAFLAGLEGFVGSRCAVRRLSSNLFSAGMMSLAAAAAALGLTATLHFIFGDAKSFMAVACALLVASLLLLAANLGVLSTLLALRHGDPILKVWRKNLLWAASMFLPTSTAASLIYFALQSGFAVVIVVGAPVLLTVYFFHRQYRDGVRSRFESLAAAHRQTVEALAVAMNAKDEVTHDHVKRVQIYAAGVARLLGCSEADVEALKAGALLHDIGKIAVPDFILHKPGKLTAEEFNQMKLHTVIGAQILSRVEFPFPVVPVVRHHHERWDGTGYPDGLRGEQIPLTARILSVVDCFDAVREDRQYRKGMTRDEAIEYVFRESGASYDPRVVATFVAHLPEFEAEIRASRDVPAPTFGIAETEQLSEAALNVAPAAGLSNEKKQEAAALSLAPDEQLALDGLAASLGACGSEEDVLTTFAERLRGVVSFDTCALVRVEPESGECRVAHAVGCDAATLTGQIIQPGAGVTGWVLVNRRPLCNTDPKLDLPPGSAAHTTGYRTLACFPIGCGKHFFGAVTLYSVALAEYDASRQSLLQGAADVLARALESRKEGRHVQPSIADAAPVMTAPVMTALESGLTH